MPSAQNGPPRKTADGFNACAILFCAAPLGILGAVTDGLSGYFYLLAVKAVMDGLAMTSFVKIFRWPAALSAFPVFVFLGAITLACQFYAKPFLDAHGLIDSVNAAAGLIACAVALVIFEVRKVELANYLPALAVAPLLRKIPCMIKFSLVNGAVFLQAACHGVPKEILRRIRSKSGFSSVCPLSSSSW